MPNRLTLTALRQKLFNVVDQVIKTGVPVEIERKGHKIKIILDEPKSKLANLKPRPCIVGDPDDLVDIDLGDWSEISKL